MKAIIQRVSSASVKVDGQVISSIGRGICVLVGIHRDDGVKEMQYIAKKLLSVRIFDNPETGKRWDKSVQDLGLEILCVSQFTLHHILKGNKVDFHLAMKGDEARDLFDDMVNEIGKNYCKDKIKTGQFGAMMTVNIENDGPVTIELESSGPEAKSKDKNQPAS